jgi:glycosyltransferase involved in cell wall biosynthesis
LAKATVMVLPLNVAGGFRSRSIEVMAMGIPIVGTSQALSNLELENGKHGYISDFDNEIANYLIKLLTNIGQLQKMSKACKEFVTKKYSIETTYGKLSNFYSSI